MGIISKGILGGFSGKVGTVIGGNWKGIAYMRSQSSSQRTRFSNSQLEQQAKFKTVMGFLNTMGPLLETGFREYAIRMTAFNKAFSYNLKNAVTGSYPDFSINYAMARVSQGDLPNASNPAAAAAAGDAIGFSWTDNSGIGKATGTDASILVAYCAALQQSIYLLQGAARSSQSATLPAAPFKGQEVHTWLGFIAESGKAIANSVYTGKIVLP